MARPLFGQASVDVAAAIEDCKKFPPPHAQLRYLSLAYVDPKQRDECYAVTSLALNVLSRTSTVYRPVRVSDTLVRVDIARYAADVKGYGEWSAAWDNLASTDPYYHLRAKVLAAPSKDTKAGDVPTLDTYTDGGWIDQKAAAELRTLTGSGGAVLRADWFVANALLPPHYYNFVGVSKDRAAYLKTLGLDDKLVESLNAMKGANLTQSGVTGKLRRVIRWPIPNGATWITYDSIAEAADADPFRNPSLTLKFDASEIISRKTNGLDDYSIFTSKGDRLDAVDPALAVDDTTHPPSALQPALSCIRCHLAKVGEEDQSGLRSFNDSQSKLLAGKVGLYGTDPREVDQVAALYARQRQLQRDVVRDREDFLEAVDVATSGMKPFEAGEAVSRVYRTYADTMLTPAMACLELGIEVPEGAKPEAELAKVLSTSHDVGTLLLLNGQSIRRKQFEAAWGENVLQIINSKGR